MSEAWPTRDDLSPEVRLLLSGIRPSPSAADDAALGRLLDRAVDWPGIMRLARRHGVFSQLAGNLFRVAGDRIPAPVRDDLRQALRSSAARSLLLLQLAGRFVDLLAAAGVPCLTFKGPVLAAQVYPDYTVRYSGDLDLLVPASGAGRAWDALRHAGWQPRHPAARPLIGLLTMLRNEMSFYNPLSASVDLHWAMEFAGFRVCRSPDVWAQAVQVPIEGRVYRTVSLDHHLLHVCAHGVYNQWQALRYVLDVAALLASAPGRDWSVSVAVAHRTGHARFLRLGAHLARRLLDAPVPQAIESDMLADARTEALADDIAAYLVDPGLQPMRPLFRPRWVLQAMDRARDRWRYRCDLVWRPRLKQMWREAHGAKARGAATATRGSP